MKFTLDWKEYAQICRTVAADGAVLLKNENKTLPVKEGEKLALFGRTQYDHISTGTGSGGMVHVPYIVNLFDALKNAGTVIVDEAVSGAYKKFVEEIPFDNGVGWAATPPSQPELLPEESFINEASQRNDIGIVIIGRIAGEDKDNIPEKGCYYLTDTETELLRRVRKSFKRMAVIMNVCNITDMEWMDEINPDAVITVWQGGSESGNAVCDVITGAVNPSGCLADTIAHDLNDYPSTANFGNTERNFYCEDVYVGYRYFETFAKEKVRYPFGYGLSYTTFDTAYGFSFDGENITVTANVTNTGSVSGKHAIQVYYGAPQGKLGKPARELVRFAKTKTLFSGCSEELSVSWSLKDMVSYDDSGVTGYRDCFVLEKGEYTVYAGDNVREASPIGSVTINDDVCVEKTSHALYPFKPFKRMMPRKTENGFEISYVDTPMRESGQHEHIKEHRKSLKEIEYTGDKNITLAMVGAKKASMDDFIAQLTDEDMITMTRGEGMCSVRVTPGVATAFGGVSDKLHAMGVPALACSDGPSGIRMDCGTIAMQGPAGNAISCTYDLPLIEKLYTFIGYELREHEIDGLLGPGMNLRRNPLNGRNFEYFSEDPYMTGAMAVAELKGMGVSNETGVIKHFCGNNQEKGRHTSDSVISARALREMYLKGFEMAVKEGDAYCIMTTYGSVNGTYTGSNFDLNTMILRKDWGYEGITMTDWWAKLNDEEQEASMNNTNFMIRAQNDLYMVTASSTDNTNGDNSASELNKTYTRAELQRNVRNILKVCMRSNAFERINGIKDEVTVLNFPSLAPVKETFKMDVVSNPSYDVDESVIDKSVGAMNLFHIHVDERGIYKFSLEFAAEDNQTSLAQLPISILLNEKVAAMKSINGDVRTWQEIGIEFDCTVLMDNYVKLSLPQGGLKLKNVRFEKIR